MPVQRKVFRIEQMSSIATPAAAVAGGAPAASQDQQILAELKALRDLIEQRSGGERGGEVVAPGTLQMLREETEGIRRVLDRTRHEIASLHAGAFSGGGRPRAARELDAIADGAERATRQILDAAEEIEDAASTLAASIKRKQAQTLAQDIHDHVIRIFEACNFQDVSGQRIAKVLATLAFVEDHIARMMDIWSTGTAPREAAGAARVLHGPRLDGEPGHASQADVDKLFATG